MKGFALRLVLKQRDNRTRKWPITKRRFSFSFSSVHTTPEELENVTITGYSGFVVEENSDKEITFNLVWLRHRLRI